MSTPGWQYRVRLLLSVCLVAGAVAMGMTRVTAAQGSPSAAAIKNPVAASAESVADGKRLYLRHCASCHGSNAEGGPGNDLIPAAPDLTDSEWKHGSTDGEIFSAIKNGVPPELNMIPFGDQLKDAEIWNVVNYLRSIAKNAARPAAGAPPQSAAAAPTMRRGSIAVDPALQQLVDRAVADLAQRLNVDRSSIAVVEARAMVWPDAAMGCPRPGLMYPQVQQEGALIRLTTGGREYAYHSGGSRPPFLCEP